MKNRKQTGFTLVEIAIVLVVIGLLLGGILKGQQLINSARVRNLADQNSGVQAAYFGFIDRFRSLPGDMNPTTACLKVSNTIANCGASPYAAATLGGNGNGRIDSIVEASAVWAHLSAAGFLNGTFSGVDAASALLTTATYPSAVPTGGIPPNAFQGPILLAHTNDYIMGNVGSTTVRLAYSFGGNIPVPLLRDLDQKLDDGGAGTGVLRSAIEAADPAVDAAFGPVVAYTSGGLDCLNGTNPETWNVDSDNQTCNAVFLY
ncbi:MAG: prepilin-type N-terminal cleavage/methylation domain-containing protein [Gammaproteobacteria bacterium]